MPAVVIAITEYGLPLHQTCACTCLCQGYAKTPPWEATNVPSEMPLHIPMRRHQSPLNSSF